MHFSLGVNFDFFGIGEFWGCKSVKNDFGLQFRFYYYERASLIGGAALKAGRSIVTITTIKTENVRDFPITRFVNFMLVFLHDSFYTIHLCLNVSTIFEERYSLYIPPLFSCLFVACLFVCILVLL